MPAFRLSIPAADLTRRLKERLRGDPPNASQKIVWQRDADSVLVHADSLVARLLDGWLLCNLNLETNQTGVQTLQFVYFVGKDGEGAGLQASCTINAPTPGGAQIAAAWGADLQRVLWDAVLDAIELTVYHAETVSKGAALTVGGFHCKPEALFVDILAGSK